MRGPLICILLLATASCSGQGGKKASVSDELNFAYRAFACSKIAPPQQEGKFVSLGLSEAELALARARSEGLPEEQATLLESGVLSALGPDNVDPEPNTGPMLDRALNVTTWPSDTLIIDRIFTNATRNGPTDWEIKNADALCAEAASRAGVPPLSTN